MTLSLTDFIALAGLMVSLIIPAIGLLVKIRRNDLFHLDMKVDQVNDTLTRIESNMTEHLRDHARGVFR